MTYANKKSLKDYRQLQIVRMDILASLYKRGYSYREMREEVMARLDLQSYSLQTVHKDINRLLAEWRETRIEDMDLAVQLELERIDDIIKEAWEAWVKSKEDYEKVRAKQQAVPGSSDGDNEISVVRMEQSKENVQSCGDPRFLEIIHRNLMERRKLLGLYASTKTEITGRDGRDLIPLSTDEIEAEIARIQQSRHDR